MKKISSTEVIGVDIACFSILNEIERLDCEKALMLKMKKEINVISFKVFIVCVWCLILQYKVTKKNSINSPPQPPF